MAYVFKAGGWHLGQLLGVIIKRHNMHMNCVLSLSGPSPDKIVANNNMETAEKAILVRHA